MRNCLVHSREYASHSSCMVDVTNIARTKSTQLVEGAGKTSAVGALDIVKWIQKTHAGTKYMNKDFVIYNK